MVERDYTADERAALGDMISVLGQATFDIYLNGNAYWRNVPATVWRYKLGGYQVLKKWLSYREQTVLGRALMPEEVWYFAEVARRIGASIAGDGFLRISPSKKASQEVTGCNDNPSLLMLL